jgi:hypothetical protein
MFDFYSCSFKKTDKDEAAAAFMNYLTFLEKEYDDKLKADILESTNPLFDSFLECHGASTEDLFNLANALRGVGNNPGGRMVVMWYLSCAGNEIAAGHLLRGLHGFLSMARHSGPVILDLIHSALESWHEEQELHLKHGIPKDGPKRIGRRKTVPVENNDDDGVVVLETLGDADSSAGKELAKRFECMLATPLPLKGRMSDPTRIHDRLTARFPWATHMVSNIADQLALLHRSGRRSGLTLPPLLLVGAPGCGKTQFLSDMFEMLSVPATRLPCGGTSDSGGLLAVARGWATSRPNGCVQAMLEKRCANPAIILDELDKASSGSSPSSNGNIMDTLLSMTDENSSYYDSCLLSNVDLTFVNFSATANSIEKMPEALKDRFTILRMPSPGVEHFDTILDNLLNQEAARLRVRRENLPTLSSDDIMILGDMLHSPNGSIRQIKNALRRILGEKAFSEYRQPSTPKAPTLIH